MTRTSKFFLVASAAWSLLASPAMAQGPPAADDTTLDEVVVTARRRDEALRAVPVAVSVLNAWRLEETGSADLSVIQQQTPNATVQAARGTNSTLIGFTRGIGQQDPLWSAEPGVGLYVDDVYIARPQGALLDIYDVARIEVLRGPQGSLYGRNTVGGAIKYVTARLGNEPELVLRGVYGSYDQTDLSVRGTLPLSDDIRIGGALASYERNGFGTNLTTGAEHYDKDVLAGRASLEWNLGARTFLRFTYDRLDDRSNARHGHREVAGATPDGAVLSGVFDTRAGGGDQSQVQTQGVALTLEHAISERLTFKSITAWREGESDTIIDVDNTPAPTVEVPTLYADEQFSQEFQMLFDLGRVQGVAGLYYLDGQAGGAFDTVRGALGLVTGASGQADVESWALFADVSADLTDRLRLSVGGRFTRDEKTGEVFRANYAGATRSPLTGGAARAPTLIRTDYVNSRVFEEFTPRAALSYDISQDLTAYAAYSRGFKSGGFDQRGDAIVIPDTVDGFEPETVDAYEVGLKGALLDGRLSFASAAFYAEYRDQQVVTLVPGLGGVTTTVVNAGRSTIYGAEFEGALRLGDHLTADLALGYLDADYDAFIRYNPVTMTYEDASDVMVFQNAPRWTGYVGMTYRNALAGGEIAVTPSVSYRGAIPSSRPRARAWTRTPMCWST